MVSYLLVMVVPLLVLIHTVSFARWVRRRGERHVQVLPIYVIGYGAFLCSGFVLWKLFS